MLNHWKENCSCNWVGNVIRVGCAIGLCMFLYQVIGAGDGAIRMYRFLYAASIGEWTVQVVCGWDAILCFAIAIVANPRWRMLQACLAICGAACAGASIIGVVFVGRFPWLDLRDHIPLFAILSGLIIAPSMWLIYHERMSAPKRDQY